MEGHGAYHRKVFAWAPPPSDSGSVPALCIFLVGVLSVTITLFVRHENNSGGSDWVFRKSDAHHCVGCFHPVLLLLFRGAVCAFCMYALSRTYQGAMFYTCVPLRACWARRDLYPSLTRNAAAIQDLELRSAHSVLPRRDYQQLGWMRSDASVETSATPAANNVNMLVETVILNYMALHGEEGNFAADRGLGSEANNRRYRAFTQLGSVTGGFINPPPIS